MSAENGDQSGQLDNVSIFIIKYLLLWSSGKGKGKGSTQEGHSKVIYKWLMVDGGYPFPDALPLH